MTNPTPLSKILEHKHLEVAARESQKPLDTFKHLLKPTDRQYQGGFIFECKKASPSEGLIREDFDITAIAKAYAPFASAISVLTDKKFFQGRFEYLAQVRQEVSCPVLCKDFVISPYQVYEARFYQADMILLMLSVLDDSTYQACAAAAQALNMNILTEIHDELELNRAIKLGAKIIGVNNRDFKTLKVDLDVSRRLLPKVPEGVLKIVESGILTHEHIREFQDSADGFLVGTSLMKQPRLDLAVRELLFGRIKICGLMSIQDAQAAYDSGAYFGGLIFADESPRCVKLETAVKISKQVALNWVAVFVNAPISQVCKTAEALGLYAVQLHGNESEAYVQELRSKLPTDIEIWLARRSFSAGGDLDGLGTRRLFDTPHKTLRGGTGESFDWSQIPASIPKDRVILSGGLGPDNITQAEQLGFWALDVNSKVEDHPGKKSPLKLHELFQALNHYQSA